eukprot:3567225-Prymnesium_polylepis.1
MRKLHWSYRAVSLTSQAGHGAYPSRVSLASHERNTKKPPTCLTRGRAGALRERHTATTY